ncbi:hypothetical protein L0F63_005540, partial [Massospora cicadina]
MDGVVQRKDRWIPLIKAYWLDYIVLILVGGVSIGLYAAPPAPTRLFPVYPSQTLPAMNIAYPIKPEIIPLWLSALTSVIFALIVFVAVLIKQRSANDFMAALMDVSLGKGQGFDHLYYDRTICRGNPRDIDDALQSFPSGHSNAAWSSLLFLFFYLNAKLKLHGNRQASYWQLLVVTSPILAATLLSLSRLLDFTHNWYDILAGSLI